MDSNIVFPRDSSFHKLCGKVIFTKLLIKEGTLYTSPVCIFYTLDAFNLYPNPSLAPDFFVKQTTWCLSKTEFNVFIFCVYVMDSPNLKWTGFRTLLCNQSPPHLNEINSSDTNEEVAITHWAFSLSLWIKVKADMINPLPPIFFVSPWI